MTKIIWEYDNLVVSDPVNLGSFEELDHSEEHNITIRHDSNSRIIDCAFYIGPLVGDYDGTFSALKDYERVLWYGNNYPGYGVSLIQKHTVTGMIDDHNGIRLADYERFEQKDIFSGQEIEILSGSALGEKALIASYDAASQIYTLEKEFSENVNGENYKIAIRDEKFFKTGQGSSYNNAIPLISQAGIIDRLDSVDIGIRVKIPKFALTAGKHLFDLKMKYTSIEE